MSFYHSDLCGSRAQSQTCLSYAEMKQSVRSDHLGSASWITDASGTPVQYLQYLPFGQPFINQRSSGYNERFTFTGKERDEETGYGYFGARYMDHELMTMWLSVDPMADKYPSISPYAYCSWNPVKLVDPDGRDFETIVDHEKKTITIRAQFYMCAGSEEQRKAFQKAINEWNSCEFEVSFPGAEKGSDNYRVCFDINNSNGEGPSNYVSFISDEDFNKYFKGLEGAGGFSDGRNIFMRNSSTNNQLLAHEMGHCLGMGDQYVSKEGLMYGTNSNDGNVSVARLGSTECRNLLSACGFNFKGPGSSAREQCKNIIPIGNAPSWFHNAKLSEVNNIIGYKEGTKKFRK